MKRRLIAGFLAGSLAAAAALLPARAQQRANGAPVLIAWVGNNSLWVAGAYVPGRGWQNDEKARPLFRTPRTFTTFNARGGKQGSVTVRKLEASEIGGTWGQIGRTFPEGVEFLALSGASPAASRRATAGTLQHPEYRRAIAGLLRRDGVATARGGARLTEHLRVDLNGDGREEVLLCAHSRDLGRVTDVRKDDYGLAVVRFLDRGTVRTAVLNKQVYTRGADFGAPQGFNALAFVDIDGDGRLEIVLADRYYEGWGFSVFTFDGKTVRKVLAPGWGV